MPAIITNNSITAIIKRAFRFDLIFGKSTSGAFKK
jgi:hypothetical protein